MHFELKSNNSKIKKIIKNENKKQFPIFEGVKLINQLEMYASREEIEADLTILIVEDRKTLIKDKIILSYGEGTNILAYLKNKLQNIYVLKGLPIPTQYEKAFERIEVAYLDGMLEEKNKQEDVSLQPTESIKVELDNRENESIDNREIEQDTKLTEPNKEENIVRKITLRRYQLVSLLSLATIMIFAMFYFLSPN